MDSRNVSLGELIQQPVPLDIQEHHTHLLQTTPANTTSPKHPQSFSVTDGAEKIFQKAKELLQSKNVVVIALGGPSRSGKGFMQAKLQYLARQAHIGLGSIPMDWFYLLKEERDALSILLDKEITFDDPESIWYSRLLHTIQALQQGIPVEQICFSNYLYDHQGSDRVWQTNPGELAHFLGNKRILIIDGIFAGHPMSGIHTHADIQVYMEADGATQAARRINADRERGRDVLDAADILLTFVVKKRNEHIDPYKASADLCISNTMPPRELMKRAQHNRQLRFLIPTCSTEHIKQLIKGLHHDTGFIEQGQWTLVDIYTDIRGRTVDDFARLRYIQGKQGIAQTSLTLSLHNEQHIEYRSSYPLYPGITHAYNYIEGLQTCMYAERSILVHKKRIRLLLGGIELYVDTEITASDLHDTLPPIQENSIALPEHYRSLPAQLKVVHGTPEIEDIVRTHIAALFPSYTVTSRTTFYRAMSDH